MLPVGKGGAGECLGLLKARPNKPFPDVAAEFAGVGDTAEVAATAEAEAMEAALEETTGEAVAEFAGDNALNLNPKALVIADEAAESEGGRASPSGLRLSSSAREVGRGGTLLEPGKGQATASAAMTAGGKCDALAVNVSVA